MNNIGERIKHIRIEKRLNQKEFCRLIELGQGRLSEIENNKTKPSFETLKAIKEKLDVSLDWLFTGVSNTDISENVFIEQVPIELSVDEDMLLNSYREMTNKGKRELQQIAKELWVDYRNPENKLLKFPAKSQPLKPVVSLDEELEEPNEQVKMEVFNLPASAGFGNYLDGNVPHDMLTFDVDSIPYGADFGIRISGDSMEPLIKDKDIVWVREQIQIDNGNIGIFVLDGEAYCKKLDIDYDERKMRLISLNDNYSPIVINKNHDLRTVGKVLL